MRRSDHRAAHPRSAAMRMILRCLCARADDTTGIRRKRVYPDVHCAAAFAMSCRLTFHPGLAHGQAAHALLGVIMLLAVLSHRGRSVSPA